MECPLCRKTSKFFANVSGRDYYKCPVCDGIFLSPAQLPSAEAEKQRYLLHQNNLVDEGYRRFLQQIIDFVTRDCPGTESILDYGCGHTPVLVQMLRDAGYFATGYDPYFSQNVALEEKFDCVTTVEVVEHFFRPAAEIERIKQYLHPKSYWLVRTMLHDETTDFTNWWYVQDFTHVFFYSARTFQWISQHFQMKIVRTNRKNTIILQND